MDAMTRIPAMTQALGTTPAPVSNRLIAALPPKDRLRFLDNCEYVDLAFSEVIIEAGEKCSRVYFPTDSFISLVAAVDDHSRLEVGIVGAEGMVGTSLVLGVNVSPLHALVQGAGPALQMSAAAFRRELERSPALREGLNRYIYVLMHQLAQTAVCTRFHVVDARLARWLLMTRDRAHSNQFYLTHEFLAYMLGVRRVGITKAAYLLEQSGVIAYHRGKVTIIDEPGLEQAACQCYWEDKKVYERILVKPRRISSRALH